LYPVEKPDSQPYLRFDISGDQMGCKMGCYPRKEDFTLQEFEEAMFKANILFGADYKLLEELLLKVNVEREPILGESIASGVAPVPGTDDCIEPKKLKLVSTLELGGAGTQVEEKDVLFQLIPGKPAQNGMNVMGIELIAEQGRRSPYHPGPHTVFNEKTKTLVALATGAVHISKDNLVSIVPSADAEPQLHFTVSPDRRLAYLSCSPRAAKPFEMDEAEERMYAARIIYGIDYDRIEELLNRVNENGETFKSEIIARGDDELDGTDAEVEFRISIDPNAGTEVEEDAEIAVLVPGIPPREGLNVAGKKVVGTEGSKLPLKVGDGCVLDRRKHAYCATRSGLLVLGKDQMLSVISQEESESKSTQNELNEKSLDPGSLKFEVADDLMAAIMLCAPKENGNFTMDEIEEALYDSGIIHGIYYERLESMVQRINEEDYWVWGEVIARGDFPRDGLDEMLSVYFWENDLDEKFIRFDPGHELENNYAQEGEPVASLLAKTRPTYGLTVTGRNIIGKDGQESALIFSDDFKFDPQSNLYLAAAEGEVVVKEGCVELIRPEKEEIVIEVGAEEGAQEAAELEEVGEKGAPLQLTVSRDLMTMSMTLRPRKSKPWTFYELEDCVYKHDVVYGIEFERMEELMIQVNETGVAVEDEVVARGELPTEGSDERAVLYFSAERAIDLEQAALQKILDTGEMAHEFLREDEKVLEIIPRVPGVDGFTVTGEKLKAKKLSKSRYVAGENLYAGDQAGIFLAREPGQVLVKGNKVGIKPVLFIDTDVSLKTGDIQFHGNIVIEGNVRSGMKVTSKESVYIDGRIEIATIQTGGDLTIVGGVQGGLHGRKAMINTGGDLRTRFCNNAIVRCRGDFLIENSLVHSDVECDGTIRIQEEGKGIMGGRVRAMLGIETSFLGSSLGIATEVFAGGYNYDVKLGMARVESSRKRLQKGIVDLMTRLRPYKGKDLDDLPKKILEKILLMRKELEEALTRDKALVQEYEKLQASLVDKSQIRVTVRNTVYPDVRIQVECSVMSQFYEPLHECVFLEHRSRPIVEVLPIMSEVEEELAAELPPDDSLIH